MAGQPQFVAAREEFNGLNSVVPGLVKTLNSAIYNAGEAFASRENEFKREIQVLEQKFQIEKLGFEKERNDLFNRLKEKEVDLKELIELKKRNCELECEKLSTCQKGIKELEAKVFSFEKKKDASLNVIAAETNAGKRKERENFVGNEATRKTNVNSSDRSSQWGRTGNTKTFMEREAFQKPNVNPSDRPSSQWERTAVQNAEEALVSREDKLKIVTQEKKEFQLKFEAAMSDKLRLEKECGEFKEMSCRLTEERDELVNRLKRKEVDYKKEISDLRSKNYGLLFDLSSSKRTLKNLEWEVSSFQKDATGKTNTDRLIQNSILKKSVDELAKAKELQKKAETDLENEKNARQKAEAAMEEMATTVRHQLEKFS